MTENQIEFIRNLNKGKIGPTKGLFIGKRNPMSRAVIMIDFETGNILREFETIKEAALFTNEKSQSNIGKVCRGERKYTIYNNKKIKWEYKEQNYKPSNKLTEIHKEKISKSLTGKNLGSKSSRARSVNMFSLTGEFEYHFSSMKEANEFLGSSNKNHHISAVCRGERETYKGHKWTYADNDSNIYISTFTPKKRGPASGIKRSESSKKKLKEKITESIGKEIVMIDPTNGELLKTFPSIRDAGRFFGAKQGSSISACLRGLRNTAYGYIWKYTTK